MSFKVIEIPYVDSELGTPLGRIPRWVFVLSKEGRRLAVHHKCGDMLMPLSGEIVQTDFS
jgi:hypothetical protein